MIYYIADMHLSHSNIIKFDNRPFDSIEQMNNILISNWNNVVTNEDIVYVLGDFCWLKEDYWIEVLDKLNGKKVLIKGNHDLDRMSQQLRDKFNGIYDYKEIKDNGKTVILSHYPIPFYRSAWNKDIVHLYGHVHETLEYDFLLMLKDYIDKNDQRGDSKHKGQFYNVGCMLPYMNYTPRTLNEIMNNAH